MIFLYNKSVTGYNHKREGSICQDYSDSYYDNKFVIITACDGHGGKIYFRSDVGSKLASDSVISVFKKYNDNYGHQEGDKILQQVAAVIKDCCRNTDFVARYGGEEFTIIMLQTDQHGAISLIERIQKKIYDLNIKHEYSEVSDRITISFGVSTAYVGTKKDYNDYIKKADKALYKSKEKGRNTYTYME